MNYPISHIELHIDDSLVEIGERLLDNGRINGLFESERNLWSANVQEGKTYEVEVQLTNNKVKAYTCDCQKYLTDKICVHITGVLLLLRENIKQKAIEKEKAEEQKTVKTKVPRQKLTTNTILKNLDPEDLSNFVRSYARNNRGFALALKARFASNVNLENNQDKYKQVLDTAINIHKPKKGINQRSLSSILTVSTELMNQADDAIVMRNFTEVIAIVEAILFKLGPINKKADNFSTWKDSIRRALSLIQESLSKDIAPDLVESIWELLKEEASKSFYRKAYLETDFFQILISLATDSSKLNQLLQMANEQLNAHDNSNQNIINLISLKLAILEKEGKTKEAELLIQENLSNPTILLIAINDAIEKNYLKRAKKLAQSGLSLEPSKNIVTEIEKTLLTVAKKEKNKTNITTYAQSLFLKTFEYEYFEILKLTKKISKKELDKLISQIKEQPYSLQKRDIVAELYFKEERYKDLLNYIQSIRSLDLLKKYDATLVVDYKKEIYDFYNDFLNNYLTNHIGRIPAQRVRDIIQHLRAIGARDLASKLVDDFRLSFSERHTLMEELQFF